MLRAALADAQSRRFFGAHAQSCLGSGLAYVALPLLAYDRFGSAWAVVAVLLLPFVLMGGFVATYNYLSFRLAAAPFDLPAAVVGLVFLAYLAGTVSSAVAGRAAQRYGRARVLALGVVVMGLGLALTLPDRLPLVVAGLVVLTAGFFAAHAVASGWAPVLGAAAPARVQAVNS